MPGSTAVRCSRIPSSPRTVASAAALGAVDACLPFLVAADAPALPDWSYPQWFRTLQYGDLAGRGDRRSLERGRVRDVLLARADVRRAIDWAGRLRPENPVAGAAAAMTAMRAVQIAVQPLPPEHRRRHVARRCEHVLDHVRQARPLTPARRGCRALRGPVTMVPLGLREPADPELEPPRPEPPRLRAVIVEHLARTGVELTEPLVHRVESGVLLAYEWWADHAVLPPTDTPGPALPGVRPAAELASEDRIASAVTDPVVRRLVAGPVPGRGRPCQGAWRWGLTYWVAVGLAEHHDERVPARTVCWWRRQLAEAARNPPPDAIGTVGPPAADRPAAPRCRIRPADADPHQRCPSSNGLRPA